MKSKSQIMDFNNYEPDNREYEWRIKRLGKVTSSKFGDLVKVKGDSFVVRQSETVEKYIRQKAWQRLILLGDTKRGLERMHVSAKSMSWGNEFEEKATQRYEEEYGHVVYRDPYNYIEFTNDIGGTPDGLVGDNGLIEIKCPWAGGNHLQALVNDTIYNPTYYFQCLGNLLVTGRKWCDFITYDPVLPRGIDLAVLRVERDEQVMAALKAPLDEIVERINDLEAEVLKRSYV